MTYQITLPFPPSVNRYWRSIARGRVIVSADGRKYKTDVVAAVMTRGRKQFDGPVEIKIVAHPPDRKRRDLDNLLKATLDAIGNAGVYKDDSQVKAIAMRWGRVLKGGCLHVEIRPFV